jgi:peptidoglycan/LPS O-acetylase OafA/YrhL
VTRRGKASLPEKYLGTDHDMVSPLSTGATVAAEITTPPVNERPAAGRNDARFVFIDALRGIACLLVVFFHLFSVGPLVTPISMICPRFIGVVLEHGYVGVEIFFVLSGFVIAFSQRGASITGRYLGNFALRRSLRLDPPYWTVIALVLITDALTNRFLTDRIVPWPGMGAILANMFYLQKLLAVPNIVGQSWTLCLEVQFYLLLTILAGLAQRLSTGGRRFLGWPSVGYMAALVPLAGISVLTGFHYLECPGQDTFFIEYWYAFFLGAMIWWTLDGVTAPVWLWGYAACLALALAGHWSIRPATVLATGVVIYGVARAKHLHDWSGGPVLQFFGMISYSLYLLHTVIGSRLMNLGKRLTHDSVPAAVMWLVFAFAASVGASYVLYHFVERSGVKWGKRFKSKPVEPAVVRSM